MRLLRSSRTTSATVPSATRSSSASSRGCVAAVKRPRRAQFRAQRQQHVEHHADARQVLARKAAARLVRVDDARGVRQHRARQVMVRDEHGDAEFVGARHAVDARDAVVDGDDQVGRLLRGELDDLRRQPVAVLEAVRHEVVDVRAHRPQAAQADRAGGRAVAVVVGHDQQARLGLDRVGEQDRGVVHVRQRGRRHQPVDQQLQVVAGARCRARPARAPARAARRRRRGAAPRRGSKSRTSRRVIRREPLRGTRRARTSIGRRAGFAADAASRRR